MDGLTIRQIDDRRSICRQEAVERGLVYRDIAFLKRQCFKTRETAVRENDWVSQLMVRHEIPPVDLDSQTILQRMKYRPPSILKSRHPNGHYKCRHRPYRKIVLLPGGYDLRFTDEIGPKTAISLDLQEYEIDCPDSRERSQYFAEIRKLSHIRFNLNVKAQSVYGRDACYRDSWLQFIEDLQDLENLQIEHELSRNALLCDEQAGIDAIFEQYLSESNILIPPFLRAMAFSRNVYGSDFIIV